MAALCNRAGHYIIALWFLSIFYLSFFITRLISAAADWMSTILLHMVSPLCEFRMQVWNANAGPKKVAKIAVWALGTIAQLCRVISFQLRHVSTIGKNLVKQQYLLHKSSQYGELGPLAAEIVSLVWGTPANFNGFRVFPALLHSTPVVGVSQTLRRW